MSLQVSAIMLGVKDVDLARRFHAEVWGVRSIRTSRFRQVQPLGEGCSVLARYEWEAAAQDAGPLHHG